MIDLDKRAQDLRHILSTPFVAVDQSRRYVHPYLDRQNYGVIWLFKDENWASEFGVTAAPTMVPAFVFGDDWQDHQRSGTAVFRGRKAIHAVVAGILHEWPAGNKYAYCQSDEQLTSKLQELIRAWAFLGLDRTPVDRTVGVFLHALETRDGEIHDEAVGILIQDALNPIRQACGPVPTYNALQTAVAWFSTSFNVDSLIQDAWLIIEGTNAMDRRRLYANIALQAPRILLGTKPEIDLPGMTWDKHLSFIAYRYLASLMLLGLREEAAAESCGAIGNLIIDDNYRSKLSLALDKTTLSLSDFRVVWPDLAKLDQP